MAIQQPLADLVYHFDQTPNKLGFRIIGRANLGMKARL